MMSEVLTEDPASEETKKGPIDLASELRQRARRVHSSRIAALHETVRVLDMSTITHLLQEAVQEAVEQSVLSDEEREQLRQETEEIFRERLEEYQSQNSNIESRSRRLQAQLERAKETLEMERRRLTNQDALIDSEMVGLEERFCRLLDRVVLAGEVDEETEKELRSVVAKIVGRERDLIRESERQSQIDRISLQERKISRLARSLETTQKDRDLA